MSNYAGSKLKLAISRSLLVGYRLRVPDLYSSEYPVSLLLESLLISKGNGTNCHIWGLGYCGYIHDINHSSLDSINKINAIY